MKRILKISLLLAFSVFFLTACGSDNLTKAPEDIIDSLFEGIEDLPEQGKTEITKENMASYIGIDDLDIESGIASEPYIMPYALSTVVVKVKSGVNVEDAVNKIKEKVDTRKWICVEAEKLIVEARGDTILMTMGDENIVNKIQENFQNLKN